MSDLDVAYELDELQKLPQPVRLRRLERRDVHNERRIESIEQKFAVVMGQVRFAAALGAIAGASIVTAIVELLLKHS